MRLVSISRQIIIISIITTCTLLWLVSWRRGKHDTNQWITTTHAVFSLSQIQSITWVLIITPGGYEQYAAIIWSAKEYLYGWLYTFTHKDLRGLRWRLADQWIDVKMVLEDKQYKSFGSDFSTLRAMLESHGIGITTDTHLGTNFVHSKAFVSSGWYIIQSANLTHSTFKSNREHIFVGTQSDIIDNLTKIFLKDWDENNPLHPSDIHPNLVICPINCRVIVETLIASAKKSLIIQTQYIQDTNIQDLILTSNVKNKRVIVADTDSSKAFLKRATPRIARALSKPYVHAKMILIDDTYLLIGSMNMSDNSLDRNREHGIIVTDPLIINQFKKQFEQDRNNSKKK